MFWWSKGLMKKFLSAEDNSNSTKNKGNKEKTVFVGGEGGEFIFLLLSSSEYCFLSLLSVFHPDISPGRG